MKKSKKERKYKKNNITGLIKGKTIVVNNRRIYDKYYFGELKGNKVYLTLYEAIYLLEKGKLTIEKNGKRLGAEDLIKQECKKDKQFFQNYIVYKFLRERGLIPKSGSKFGVEFRVYQNKQEKHSKWLAKVYSINQKLNVRDIISINRVAHSTNKKLLLCFVDEEEDVTILEVGWFKIK